MNKKKSPILISGSHRSGTTWVGKTINTSSKVFYIHEPFNKINLKRYFNIDLDVWFPYITVSNQSIIKKGFDDFLKGNIFNIKYSNISLKRKTKLFIKNIIIKTAFLRNKRFILKDPIAIFSSEWISETYQSNNIILIRHPAAFVSSLKKNNWTFDFSEFYKQSSLMGNHLKPFTKEIDKCIQDKCNIVDQGILLWNIIHAYIYEMQKKHDEWYFVRHEDISNNPIKEFRNIFNYLNLPWTSKTERYILKTTSSNNASERSDKNIHQLKRDSKSNIYNWKKRLSPKEIEHIKNKTNVISSNFYNDNEW